MKPFSLPFVIRPALPMRVSAASRAPGPPRPSRVRHGTARRIVATLCLLALAGTAALVGGVRPALAQAWPARPILMIVPFSAGGGVDSQARIVSAKLAELLKQPVVVENVAGAAGTIGSQRAARSTPDGYTLLFAVASPLNVAPLVSPGVVRYDTFRDFTPIATAGFTPFVLIGRKDLAPNSTEELIALARAQPGRLNFGTDGVGTSLHLTAELLKQRAGIDLSHVPYKLGTQVLTDVAGGNLDLAVLPLTLAKPFIKDGKVRAYGVTSRSRAVGSPEIPALAETAALNGFDVDSWSGLLAPAGLPPQVQAQLTEALETAMKDPDVVRRMGEIAVRPEVISGKAFADYLAAERRTLQEVVSRAGIKPE